MSDLTRFSVSIEKELLAKFDRQIRSEQYPTRSKAIADLIRNDLVKRQWAGKKDVAGVIILVYDHHKRGLSNRLTSIQHHFHNLVVSTQHIHLDHRNCLEIVVVKGKPRQAEELAHQLKTTKGVKHGSLAMATTGKEI
jgi:CopG family nickel-responsive transcriptional regulator